MSPTLQPQVARIIGGRSGPWKRRIRPSFQCPRDMPRTGPLPQRLLRVGWTNSGSPISPTSRLSRIPVSGGGARCLEPEDRRPGDGHALQDRAHAPCPRHGRVAAPARASYSQCDQGTQYTSIAFGLRCKEVGVRPSMGSVGDPYDDQQRFRTQAEAKMPVFDFVESRSACREGSRDGGRTSPRSYGLPPKLRVLLAPVLQHQPHRSSLTSDGYLVLLSMTPSPHDLESHAKPTWDCETTGFSDG